MTTPNSTTERGVTAGSAQQITEPLSQFVCSDCGTQLYVGWDCHKCGGFGASTPEEYAADAPRRESEKVPGKYDDVLRPFSLLMEKELHANCGKGDRPGWLSMTPQTALLEIYYHVSKLQKAVKNNSHDAIREYSADVANMAMMLLDVCVGIQPLATPSPAQAEPTDVSDDELAAATKAYNVYDEGEQPMAMHAALTTFLQLRRATRATGAAEGAEPTDAERLDWLQKRGATVSIVQGNGSDFEFQVAGLHATVRPKLRAAIDAAIRAGRKQAPRSTSPAHPTDPLEAA